MIDCHLIKRNEEKMTIFDGVLDEGKMIEVAELLIKHGYLIPQETLVRLRYHLQDIGEINDRVQLMEEKMEILMDRLDLEFEQIPPKESTMIIKKKEADE